MESDAKSEIDALMAIRDTFLPMSAILIFTTAGSKEEARRIAKSLVESRLAACVNVVPKVESVYRWEDNVETSEEWLLIIKSVSRHFDDVKEAISKLHSFDLPECISIEIADGESGYLKWIADSTHS